MGTLIGISSPQVQLRQNHSMLLFLASVSSFSGLLLWSASPFALNNPKDKVQVVLRYLSLFTSLSCGITAIACGSQLQKINPLVKAIETAEKNDFLEQLAVSQYQQQQYWQQRALAPTQLQTLSAPLSDQVQPESADALSESLSDTSQSELPTSTNSEVNGSEHFRSLYKSVSLLKEQGLSDTKLVEEVLGMGGRKFNEGKQMLDVLLQLGQSKGW
jgi:hypothetical protein